MAEVRRVFVIVLDSVGVGALPDAHLYGDEGSNTLGNIAKALGGLGLPNLGRLGLGNLLDIPGTPPETPLGAACRMAERSPGKDTTTGHWELFGITLKKPFRTYPQGFPDCLIRRFEGIIGRKTLWNKPASGTLVIEDVGPEHLETGYPIVYTSADSVMQIACHEDIAPLDLLYSWCEAAMGLFTEPASLARVIARPFRGSPGSFERTPGRRDFSVPPPDSTLFDYANRAGVVTVGIGKVGDIFAGRSIDMALHTASNREGVGHILSRMQSQNLRRELVLANLVDFDTLYGHRNDVSGYGRCLQEFDSEVPRLLASLYSGDILVISADHGCDPTTPSTDHSREYVPMLMAGDCVVPGVVLPDRSTFADLGATIAEFLGINYGGSGSSFARDVLRQ